MEQPIEPDQRFSRKIVERSAKTLYDCIQCGTCTASCLSGVALKTRMLIREAQLGIKDVLKSEDLWLCTTCYSCYELCPNDVDAPDIIITIRNMAVREGIMAEAHKKAARNFLKKGHLVPLDDEHMKIRKKIGLQEHPPIAQFDEKSTGDIQKFLKKIGFNKLIGED